MGTPKHICVGSKFKYNIIDKIKSNTYSNFINIKQCLIKYNKIGVNLLVDIHHLLWS